MIPNILKKNIPILRYSFLCWIGTLLVFVIILLLTTHGLSDVGFLILLADVIIGIIAFFFLFLSIMHKFFKQFWILALLVGVIGIVGVSVLAIDRTTQIESVKQTSNLLSRQQHLYTIFTKEMNEGSTGDEVKILQYVLGLDTTLYPEHIISGYFGPATGRAVKRYQAMHSIVESGVVDTKTLFSLNTQYGAQDQQWYLDALPKVVQIPQQTQGVDTNLEWGTAKQVSEHIWTMKVGQDSRMATPQEIFEALNAYRNSKGVGSLIWNTNLSTYAQQRADDQFSAGKLDSHAGFQEYVKNQDNLKRLGFRGVGENSSGGYQLLGVHLIEWVYAGDEPHDNNQRNPIWTHVGIGVHDTFTDIIFGTGLL